MPQRTFFRVRSAARALSFAVHDAAQEINGRRVPGLKNQLLRAASSVPANIAEGEQQSSDAQAAHFLRIALGSTDEVGAHLDTAAVSGSLSRKRYTACQGTRMVVRTMLTRLLAKLEPER